jgi:hypothetical protein
LGSPSSRRRRVLRPCQLFSIPLSGFHTQFLSLWPSWGVCRRAFLRCIHRKPLPCTGISFRVCPNNLITPLDAMIPITRK